MIDTASLFLTLTAFFALLPSVILQWRYQISQWQLLLVSLVGVAGLLPYSLMIFQQGWRVDLAATLYCILITGWVFTTLLAQLSHSLRSLVIYIQLYWVLYFALILPLLIYQGPALPFLGQLDRGIFVHILFALISYILLTHSAVIGVVMLWKQYQLKRGKGLMALEKTPALVEGEHIMQRFMLAAFLILSIDILLGVTLNFQDHGRLFVFNHKEVFALCTLLAIALLLILHKKIGLRGRHAMGWIAGIFLMATLGFPGVKFVQQIIL